MSTVLDYEGRTVDLVALQNIMPPGSGNALLVQSLIGSDNGGQVIAGIEKLMQRFVLGLFMRLGTSPYQLSHGTTFLLDFDAGLWRTVVDVTQSFYAALLGLEQQLAAIQLSTDPPDEVYGSAELLSVLLVDDKVTLHISLVSAAGSEAVFLSPLNIAIN